jgi:Protein of unknown function (DUF1580)
MIVDIATDRILSLNEAANLLGRRVSYSTWWRWGKRGINGHRLTLTRVGGHMRVSVAALQEFIAAINGEQAQPARTSRQRQAAIKKAEAECTAAGI